jgi:hypothetical protein
LIGTTEVGNSTELRSGKIGSAPSMASMRWLSGPEPMETSVVQARAPGHSSSRARRATFVLVTSVVGRGSLLVGLSALVLGCASPLHAAPTGPSDALAAYSRALATGRANDAYRMLSDEARRSITLDAFARMVRENPDDVRELARALGRPASVPVVTARVQAPTGESLELVLEDGAWKLDGLALDRYGQSSPRQALEGFLRAYERGRFDVILRYVPDRELEGGPSGPGEPRESLTAEKLKQAWTGPQRESIDAIVQAIRAALSTAVIEETQDRAAMAYGAGGTVSFVRERGRWKLANLR